ncbi:hypothetical protein WMY93_015927 [Mugilogobius chulae]|uniref:Uncharacterized protein n=1 Tax=Mugilogobius chulae TaxID=88201 RepID=A0AAW0NYN1_9GOBI
MVSLVFVNSQIPRDKPSGCPGNTEAKKGRAYGKCEAHVDFLVILSELLLTKECRMSVTLTKTEGKTMLTVISDGDPLWSCPLLCQILTTIYNCTGACTVSNSLRSPKKSSHSALGALQIMIGIINIGFGSILLNSLQYSYGDYGDYGYNYKYYYYDDMTYTVWCGTLFILFGVTSILCDRFPRRCAVVLSVLLNLSGVGFAIKAIVVNSSMLSDYWPWSSCLPDGRSRNNDYDWDRYRTLTTTTQSPDEAIIRRSCSESYEILFYVQKSMFIVLTVLSVLELLVVISTAALSIKALKKQSKCSKGTPRSAPTTAGED